QAIQANQTNTKTFTGKNRKMEVSEEWFQNLRLEEQQLIKVLVKEPKITQKRVAELLSWNISTVKYYIRKLIKKGIIQREGTSQKGFWKLLYHT
ncbi:MAG: winged helix-turn-helix domain-containing protein, partial [Candidatus Riflebacteria bacterium]|nr:winged helix-turn-helix domain-containing protein [Candidatus Riflebacteria bacterium]